MKKFKILIIFLCFTSYLGAQNYIMYTKDSVDGAGRDLFVTSKNLADKASQSALNDTAQAHWNAINSKVSTTTYEAGMAGKIDLPDSTTNNITTSIVLTFATPISTHRPDTISGNVTVSISLSASARPSYTKTYILIGSGNSRTINYGSCKKASGSGEYDDTAGVINVLMFRLLSRGTVERTLYYLQ